MKYQQTATMTATSTHTAKILASVLAVTLLLGWSQITAGQFTRENVGTEVTPKLEPQADLIITGGEIATMDQAIPTVDAIAIANGRILAIGSVKQMEAMATQATKRLELNGEFVMPGFIEGHAHFLGLGQSLMMLGLRKAKTWSEIETMVAEQAEIAEPGEWIVGRGWHQSKWTEKPTPNVDGYPTVETLSRKTPNNPVLLTHASGHMSLANEYGMRLAGVTDDTQNPAGGEIIRDSSGKATGVFRETAAGLISRVRSNDVAKLSNIQRQKQNARAIELASEECLRFGITSFQDAGSSFDAIKLLKRAAESNDLGVRLWVMVLDSNPLMRRNLSHVKCIGYANEYLTVRAIKRSIDGALGAHGAWLLAPYTDLPSSTGLNTASIESVTESAALALENDFQVCVHAIGDRANREVLDIYEKLFAANPSNVPRRWRIEHAQHLHPDDIPRFGKLGVIASMQAVHCTSDAIFVPKRLGMRRSGEGAYVWKSLLDSGAVVTNGTDAPVESIDPLPSFYASVTRRLGDDVTFFPEQSMTRMQALRSYTIDCAYAAFEESSKGSLVPGKLADITILDTNLLNCSDEEILAAKVNYTIVGGEIKYDAKQPKQ